MTPLAERDEVQPPVIRGISVDVMDGQDHGRARDGVAAVLFGPAKLALPYRTFAGNLRDPGPRLGVEISLLRFDWAHALAPFISNTLAIAAALKQAGSLCRFSLSACGLSVNRPGNNRQ